jgi:hypothetical protein
LEAVQEETLVSLVQVKLVVLEEEVRDTELALLTVTLEGDWLAVLVQLQAKVIMVEAEEAATHHLQQVAVVVEQAVLALTQQLTRAVTVGQQ